MIDDEKTEAGAAMKHISKYIIYLTPKALSRLDVSVIPEEYKDYEFVAEPLIYANMSGGWTEDDCDSVAYIVERSSNEQYILPKVIKC